MDILKMTMTMSGLVWNGALDMRRKQISLAATLVYAIIGVGYQAISKQAGVWMLVSLLPGLFALALARLTAEKIGYGDGVVLLALGCYLGIEELLLVCMAAVCFAGVIALILLVVFRKDRNYAIPFVPFLLCGYITECFLCG